MKKELVFPISPSRHNSVSAEVPGARPGQDPRRLRTAQPSRVGPKSHVGWRVSLGRAATTGSQVPLATQQDKRSREPIYEEELEAVLRAKEVGCWGMCPTHPRTVGQQQHGLGPEGVLQAEGGGWRVGRRPEGHKRAGHVQPSRADTHVPRARHGGGTGGPWDTRKANWKERRSSAMGWNGDLTRTLASVERR